MKMIFNYTTNHFIQKSYSKIKYVIGLPSWAQPYRLPVSQPLSHSATEPLSHSTKATAISKGPTKYQALPPQITDHDDCSIRKSVFDTSESKLYKPFYSSPEWPSTAPSHEITYLPHLLSNDKRTINDTTEFLHHPRDPELNILQQPSSAPNHVPLSLHP